MRKPLKILLYLSAGVLGLILVLLLAVKLALDRVPHYQAEIKQWVHDWTGYHIGFAHVSPAFRWYGPELYFDQLELRSKDDRTVLAHAAGGRIGIDVWELVRSGKLFAGRIELDAPQIALTRTGPQEFSLASGVSLGKQEGAMPAVRLNDLPAGTFAIRRGLVSVVDWNSSLTELTLRDVDLDLRRGDDALTLAVAARLPAALGGTLSLNATVRGPGTLDSLSWRALARAHDLAFGGWRQLLPDYLGRLEAGTGGFDAAIVGRGADLTRADLEADAADVTVQLTNEPPVMFERIAGALTVTHAGDSWNLMGRRLRAQRGGHRDPDSEFDVSWRGDDAGLTALTARASYLRAETLLPLAGLLPQKDLRERLQEIEPTGEWVDTHVTLDRSAVSDPWKLSVLAKFRNVGFAAVGTAPGLRGLSGMIAGTDSGGRVEIESDSAVFTWPAQLPEPIDVDALKTTLYWKRDENELLVATPSIALRNQDATIHGRVAWHHPSNGDSPVLTLAIAIDDGNVAATHRYLPRGRLPAPTLAWLNRGLVAGRMPHADVIIQGPIQHFPFRDGTGLFLAHLRIVDMTVDYRDGWPPAEKLSGTMEFHNEGMSAQLVNGSLGPLVMEKGDLRFVDFKTAELQLHASASGDAATALAYLRATPLDALAEHAFSGVEAQGSMRGDIDLFFPFKEFDQRRTLVRMHLNGVSVNRVGSTLTASELNGDLDVDGAQVARADVRGRILGGAFQMQARTPKNLPVTRTLLVFSGAASGEAIRDALHLPGNVSIDGATDWRGVLRMAPEPARERSLKVSGNLVGLQLNLPDPLAKPANQSMPSSFEVLWPQSGPTQLRLSLGSVLHGQASLDTSASGPGVVRAAIAFGAGSEPAAFSDSQVLSVGGSVDRFDLGGWLKLYTPDKNANPVTNYLRTAKFEVGQLDYLGFSFLDVTVDLAATDTGWRIGLGGPNVVGTLSLPNAVNPPQPWQLNFQRLKFADQQAASGTASEPAVPGAAGANPRAVPALNFHAADVIWGERQLGDVTATLSKADDGILLDNLVVAGASFTVNAKGEWRGKEEGTGRIQGTLASTDVAATLKQLGYADVIEAKTGKMDFDISWVGAPTAEAATGATGRVQVALDKGQITGLKPGAGRVVGLASIAALPRRLALDFSDLTDKGFAFDTIRGDFDLRDGSAFTDDVLVKGPAADIGLIGRVGLKNKDYDQTAVVTGNVGSTLPLAAFAGGPVIGAAVLVFTQVFKQPLRGLARGYYRITGSWDNPTVERIKSADAAAATAEAPK